ncbi:type VI secretion system contractile sheath large subunit [Caulobacter flavus]|uniref:Type VI secretion system contractile sheath large subunit n=1 Tax=Caulobacter flavus TaxID=1679497 RepID=A0A2N5CZF4_9CAUL|nr:type VI secretion system contractile sheath large subunit [Caulobacter flavus]AYV45139.1 type VI secretion system contractile sheath large subunit [Caulobacter flavus]PLR19181.1 type VI secretion system contractile sheath large subunit [Caulobacter flavus]
MASPSQQSVQTAQTVATNLADDFTALLQKEFKPRDPHERIQQAVQTLAQLALKETRIIGGDVLSTLEQFVAQIDAKLSEQINEILHAPEFQRLESAWRGLNFLVENAATGENSQIKVMNVTKKELEGLTRSYRDSKWDQSPLHKQIYDEEYGTLGGVPFGAFVCDYYFDHSSADIDVMSMLGKIGEDAHAPFLTAAAPSLLRQDGWSGLADLRDLSKAFVAPEYIRWRSFRESDESRYVALTMPRFLGRQLYGPDGDPVDEFHFVEDVGAGDHDKYLWVNAAYGLGLRVIESFLDYGWCTSIRGVNTGGTLYNLPVALFPTDEGGKDAKCPTEISISERREGELSNAGLFPLTHRKNTNQATFMGGQTAYKPQKMQGSAASASEELSAKLPYIFISSRFAHYLKVMVRDWVGASREEGQLERDLQSWVNQYVNIHPDSTDPDNSVRQPLREAHISVTADPARPGYYRTEFLLRPHFQFEHMDISLSMVSRLPKSEGGGA